MHTRKSERTGKGLIKGADSGLFDVPCALAPAGYYAAIRVGFVFPLFEQNCLPESWVREYTVSGFLVHDPSVAWAYRNVGSVRTSELAAQDAQGVFELAKDHGLIFGVVLSHMLPRESGERSFGFFFRRERDFTELEIEQLNAWLSGMHRAYDRPKNLTLAELETLGLVKNGLLMKEIASTLGVSESAVKQRLRNARLKLNAKTGSQAAARATMLGMI